MKSKKPYPLSGLRDKLYWRKHAGLWHCFKKATCTMTGRTEFWSLCERVVRERSGGQACSRPDPRLRCGVCDGKEMSRRGWTFSGPASRG